MIEWIELGRNLFQISEIQLITLKRLDELWTLEITLKGKELEYEINYVNQAEATEVYERIKKQLLS